MRKIILSLSAALLASTPVWAINCQVETDCATLGYTSDTDEGGCLKCPFGNKWACSTSGGVSKDCVVGAILNSDMSCSADVVSGKTPIGVVVSSERQFAIALDQTQRTWSTNTFDIPYINASPNDANGQYNTYVGYDYCRRYDQSCPAFEYVSEYKTEGTKAGDWYLPSIVELFDIFAKGKILNTTLTKLGGTPLYEEKDSLEYIWSSTEDNYTNSQTINFSEGIYYGNIYDHGITKTDARSVRPAIKFPKPELNPKPTFDACETGAILFSDKTCSDDAVSGKTPIGIVFDGEKRLAIALLKYSSNSLAMADEDFEITSLEIYNENYAQEDWNGKENTKIILDYCKANGKSCPAAEYAASYSTEGTKAGDWYLPAVAEAASIYQNAPVLKESAKRMGKSLFSIYNYWTSTGAPLDSLGRNLWAVNLKREDTNAYSLISLRQAGMTSAYEVLPVLAF